MPFANRVRFCAHRAFSLVAAVVALAASDAKSAVFDRPSETSQTNPIWGTTPNGMPWSAVASGTVLPVRTSATSPFNGAPGAVVYFNVRNGQLQVDPRGYDLNSVIITYTTGTVNIGGNTPGPFTYATGTAANAWSPATGTPKTFPAIQTLTGLPPTTFAARVGTTIGSPLSPALTNTGDVGNIASTGPTGYWNLGWSFPLDLVASGSVAIMEIQNFKTIGQNSNANANILGYGLGFCTFQYGINGVVGNQVGAVVPVAVPEPSTCAMALAGLACGGWHVFRTRRRRTACSGRRSLVALLLVTCSLLVGSAQAAPISMDMVTVGNPGNVNDTTGYGAVASSYKIGKYEVTIGQYCAFLNAVAATDQYGLYNANMGSDIHIKGIGRAGTSGNYTYSVLTNSGSSVNRPISYVSWFDAARFANWLSNNQPVGTQGSTTTENGAYNLNGATSGVGVTKNVINPNTGATPTFWIPSENEWYKAAYYDPSLNSNAGGYFAYATRSNIAPGNTIGSAANQANFFNGSYTTGAFNQNSLTDAGAFSGSASAYGTFDQAGNVREWNDAVINGTSRGQRGGAWNYDPPFLASSSAASGGPAAEDYQLGFRLAAPAAVPEPSTYAMALAGLACGGYSMFRRRRTLT